ncbi:MAG: hypothetical protein ABJH04_20365 [Cyclobacteriaceae bacterium]|jgi:hypothetical protein
MKTLIALIVFLLAGITGAYAQCAMCRATLENNVSNGDPGIAAGINFGIMYLFFAPYVAVGAVAFFWYKTTRSNARKELERRTVLR